MGKVPNKRIGLVVKIAIIAIFIAVVSLTLCYFFVYRKGNSGESSKMYTLKSASNSAYICMRADTLEVFDEYNKDQRLPMASTTKTMTALLVIENCTMDEIVTVPKCAVGVEGSSVYLKEGDKYTVKELLYGLMLRSGNDVAVCLAVHVTGSVKNFVDMMNYRAETLNLKNTHFANPHGLHDENHYTSAYDLCKLSCFAMQNKVFKEIVGTKKVTVGSGELRRVWCNKNKILSLYDGGNGIKTGFTKNAGRCLIASAERNGITVVSVVLNRGDMFNECMTLMDNAYDQILGKENP